MGRIIRKDVVSAFTVLVTEMGGRIAKNYKDVGGYLLDYAPCYGGYSIAQICNEAGGQSHPLGYRRMSAREAYHTFWCAVETLRHSKREVTR